MCHEPDGGREGEPRWIVRRYRVLSARSLLPLLWHPRQTFPMPGLLRPQEWQLRQWAYLRPVRYSLPMIPL